MTFPTDRYFIIWLLFTTVAIKAGAKVVLWLSREDCPAAAQMDRVCVDCCGGNGVCALRPGTVFIAAA